jgi:hypothetical protein
MIVLDKRPVRGRCNLYSSSGDMDRIPTSQMALTSALQLIGAPACACDRAGTIIAANPELAALIGAACEGRALADLLAPASVAPSVALLRQARSRSMRGSAATSSS